MSKCLLTFLFVLAYPWINPVDAQPSSTTYQITTQKTYTRGRMYLVSWQGRGYSDQLTVHLYKGDDTKEVATFKADSSGTIVFDISVKAKYGTDYTLVMQDAQGGWSKSAPFTIKRKIPLLLKPLAVVVAGVAAVIIFDQNAPDPTPANPFTLPNPSLPK